jgi:hypothetical protein
MVTLETFSNSQDEDISKELDGARGSEGKGEADGLGWADEGTD